jgi:hypothetical protein
MRFGMVGDLSAIVSSRLFFCLVLEKRKKTRRTAEGALPVEDRRQQVGVLDQREKACGLVNTSIIIRSATLRIP